MTAIDQPAGAGQGVLEVRYNDTPIAVVRNFGMNTLTLEYNDIAVAAGNEVRVSVRMPPRAEPYTPRDGVLTFFDGLLPEGWIRDELARARRLDPADTFSMLAEFGEDCAGALTFSNPDAPLRDPSVRWLSDAEVAELVAKLRVAPLGVIDDGVRISLGGVQEKVVVTIDNSGRVGLPIGGAPSTHIMKPTQLEPDGSERFPGIVRVEHFCMTLARRAADADAVRFNVPVTSVTRLADRDVLLVDRYDRRSVGGRIERIHQEDMCQALGLPPGRKYQNLDQHPPSLEHIAAVLRRYGQSPVDDLPALAQQVTLSACVGNADQHAKNLSVLHDGSAVRLSPVYDVVSTAAYAGVNAELGMRVGGQYHLDDVDADALIAELRRWRIGERSARAAIRAVCEPMVDLAADVASELAAAGLGHDCVEAAATRARGVAASILQGL